MSAKLRVIGGVCPPSKPGELVVNPAVDSLSSVIGKLSAVLNVPEDRTKSARVSPVIKGKKGDPLVLTETFGSRGISNNDVLFVVVPPKPGTTPTPRPASPVSPKSPVGKVIGKKMLSKTIASPVGKKALSPPSSAVGAKSLASSPPSAKAPVSVPAKAISGKSSPAGTSPKTKTKKKVPVKPAASLPDPSDEMDFASAFSGGMLGGGKPTSSTAKVESGSDDDEEDRRSPPPPKTRPTSSVSLGGNAFSHAGVGGGVGDADSSDDSSSEEDDDLGRSSNFNSGGGGGGGSVMLGGMSPSQLGSMMMSGNGSMGGSSSEDEDDATDDSDDIPIVVPEKVSKKKDTKKAKDSAVVPSSSKKTRSHSIPSTSTKDEDAKKKKSSSRSKSPSEKQKGKVAEDESKKKLDSSSKRLSESKRSVEPKASKSSSSSKKTTKSAAPSVSSSPPPSPKILPSQSKPLPATSATDDSSFDDSSDADADLSTSRKSKKRSPTSPSSSPIDVEKIVHEAMRSKLDEIGTKHRLDDEGQRQKFEEEIRSAVERELKAARSDLVSVWETQREEATKAQQAIEEQRLSHIKSTVEREAQLQESQVKFIDALQVRRSQEDQQDEHLSELLRANKELREDLKERRKAADKRVQDMAESYNNSSILNPDNRVDNILLIQSQIARSLKSFNSLPTHLTPAHISDFDASVSMPVLLTTLGLERYVETLVSRDITPSTLLGMTDDDLRSCGVDTLGARRRILAEVQRRKNMSKGGGGVPHHNNKGAISTITTPSTSSGGRTTPPPPSSSRAHLIEIHSRILRGFFKKHDDSLVDRVQEFIGAFGGGSSGGRQSTMDDLYLALAYKYKIHTSSYRSVMISYLATRHPDLQGATDIIGDVFEGHEAEFGELVETLCLRRSAPPKYVWVHYHSPDRTSFYFNALCGLSQTKPPRSAIANKETVPPAKMRKFSVPYPSLESEVKYLGDGYHFPNQQKDNDNEDDDTEAMSESERRKKSSSRSKVSKVPVVNACNYQPNPSSSDDATSFGRVYLAHVCAHLFLHHPEAVNTFSAQAIENKGRELEWLMSLRANSALLAGL